MAAAELCAQATPRTSVLFRTPDHLRCSQVHTQVTAQLAHAGKGYITAVSLTRGNTNVLQQTKHHRFSACVHMCFHILYVGHEGPDLRSRTERLRHVLGVPQEIKDIKSEPPLLMLLWTLLASLEAVCEVIFKGTFKYNDSST